MATNTQRAKASHGKALVKHAQLLEYLANRVKVVRSSKRLLILLTLREKEQGVVQLSRQTGWKQETLSHHLALLRHEQLIETRREGKHNIYRLTDSGNVLVKAVRNLPSDETDTVEIPPPLLKEVGQVTNDPDGWMRRPNFQFEGRRPVDLLGTPDEPRILRIIRAAQEGFFA